MTLKVLMNKLLSIKENENRIYSIIAKADKGLIAADMKYCQRTIGVKIKTKGFTLNEMIHIIDNLEKYEKCEKKAKRRVGYKENDNYNSIINMRKKERPVYVDFYKDMIKKLSMNPVSQESGDRIPYPSAFNVCHILPKSSYPSVGKNTDNIIFLTWKEHTRFDDLLSKREFEKLRKEMPYAYAEMIHSFKKIKDQVEEKQKKLFLALTKLC